MQLGFLLFATLRASSLSATLRHQILPLTSNYLARHSILPRLGIRMATNDNNSEAPAKCVPCSSLDKSALLSTIQIEDRLKSSLRLWKIQNNESVLSISKKFTAKNFQAALECINSMGFIAEREGHHPDFHLTNYRDVEVEIFTHKLQGVTENDLNLAKMIEDEVDVVYSPKWIKEHPEANM